MKIINFVCIIILFLTLSCTSTKYVEVPIETVRTEYINQLKRDSIYIHDSINTIIKGDTVYKTSTKYIYKHIYYKDTVLVRDTIPKVITKEIAKEVEVNKLKWYQTVLIYLGLGSLLFLGGKALLNKIKSWI